MALREVYGSAPERDDEPQHPQGPPGERERDAKRDRDREPEGHDHHRRQDESSRPVPRHSESGEHRAEDRHAWAGIDAGERCMSDDAGLPDVAEKIGAQRAKHCS